MPEKDYLYDKSVPISIEDNGIPIQSPKSYGIGIDCHSKFIQVCVISKYNDIFYSHQKDFPTDWNSLLNAKKWCVDILQSKTFPVVETTETLHYCIESTSTYHFPILLSWEGSPSIVNPLIAGATKRKTDVLDAQLLATHDLVGLWRESYIPSSDSKELRLIMSERERCIRESTAASNRINNMIIRFGLTVGRSGSVVKNSEIRKIIENCISSASSIDNDIYPIELPSEVKCIIQSEYDKYDNLQLLSAQWLSKARKKVLSMSWETGDSEISGKEMLEILTSAPQVGEVTAIVWMTHIITPRRFPNSKALSAYCGLDPSLKISANHVTSTKKRGGNKALHKVLTQSADRLIRNHSEAFGQWGYNLYKQTGKWKKATNAVARKLSVALYHMMLTGSKFTYDHYNLVKDIYKFDIPLDELVSIEPAIKRYIGILRENGIYTTMDLAEAYLSCSLGNIKGLGRKFYSLTRNLLNNQKTYIQAYEQYVSAKEG